MTSTASDAGGGRLVRVSRILPSERYQSLAAYVAAGGGKGLDAARAVSAETVIEELAASGLRGRGGAGFPTGIKWRTIKAYASSSRRTSIVVNAAEGEPGTFKDRAIIRANPYAVLEGALIAAQAMDADTIVVATKARFGPEISRLVDALAEVVAAGWTGDVRVRIVQGPAEYLYGEETALLEVIDGRPPFPRIAPPFRRGIDEIVLTDADIDAGSGLAAPVQMAGTQQQSEAPPVLVNNIETMANVPGIIANGATWFRSLGTNDSPGTLVCTISGAVRRPGVAEVAMGTTLHEVIDDVGGGVHPGRHVRGVLVGVSSAVITPEQLDTALTYEAMTAIGSGLGSGGYIVFDDETDPTSVTAGVSRFLAIESCGQCTACKHDGADIARLLGGIAAGTGRRDDLATIDERLQTVADGARCSLGRQHQTVVGSLVEVFRGQITARLDDDANPLDVVLIAELDEIDDAGAYLDASFVDKQPDWTYRSPDSGKTPVERFTDHRAEGTSSEAASPT